VKTSREPILSAAEVEGVEQPVAAPDDALLKVLFIHIIVNSYVHLALAHILL